MYLSLIQEAYNIYRDRTDATVPKSEIAQNFKAQNSYEISNIKFIGVWDTVGSLGIPLKCIPGY